jgi:hypothetical protein
VDIALAEKPISKSKMASIGFHVRSGYAIVLVVTGDVDSPHPVSRSIVELSDPNLPETKQPYHARMGTLETDNAKINQRKMIIEEVAVKSITGLLKSCLDSGYKIRNAALAIGSETDPSTITNDHIRAHALEGQLFRTVLQKALVIRHVPVTVVLKRDLFAKAQTALGQSEENLKRSLTALGTTIGTPWRADDKIAALAAWMNLK